MPRYANVTPLATQTVTLLVSKNPKRPGSAAHARFNKYKSGATVAVLLKAGLTIGDLKWDLAHGFIKLNGTGQPSKPVLPAANTGKPAGNTKAKASKAKPAAPQASPPAAPQASPPAAPQASPPAAK